MTIVEVAKALQETPDKVFVRPFTAHDPAFRLTSVNIAMGCVVLMATTDAGDGYDFLLDDLLANDWEEVHD